MPRASTCIRLVSAAILASLPIASQAQMRDAPACPAPVAPTGDFAPWAHPLPLSASGDATTPAPLSLGTAAQVRLLPTPDVHYAMQPEKPGGSVSYGGLLILDITRAGTYRIALGSAAWLDVIGADGPQRSVAHGHGPDCTGIRKMVDFTLAPGRYTIQISANAAPALTVMALAMP